MKKYWTVFKISWQRELEYRTNFFFWRIRNIIILVATYFLWTHLAGERGEFLGYSQKEIVSYVILASLLRTIVYGGQVRLTAREINDGTFSIYLLRPINHFFFVFSRELAQRIIFLIAAIIEVVVFVNIVETNLVWQKEFIWLAIFFVYIFLAVVLYFILSYCISLIAFWTREAMGPRFLFEWILELSAGSFFPLNVFSGIMFALLSFLPFAQLIYFPIRAYLGKESVEFLILNLAMTIFWIAIFTVAAKLLWKKGLKRFVGEGI